MAFSRFPTAARCIAVFVSLSCLCHAEDWPQWMGPTRDNVWAASNIIKEFPSSGPKVLWSAPVAIGYAGPAVVGNRVFVTDFVTQDDVKVANFQRKKSSGEERVLCLDADSGKVIWSHQYPVEYAISYPSGPRCTPLVHDGMVYTLGAEGNLKCFQAASGDIAWERNLKEEYATTSALWGYAAHPQIDGQKLITLVGGAGSHVVAFNKDTGAEIWKHGTADEQGYAPPKIATIAGVRQMIVASPNYVESINPETGSLNWKQDYAASSGSIIMTPVVHENFVFVGGYSNRNLMVEVTSNPLAAKTLFRDKPKTGISPVNVQPFQAENLLYGLDQGGELMAVEIPTGKRVWSNAGPFEGRSEGNGTAFIVRNGDRFLLFCETGELVIAKMSPEGYEEIDRVKVIEPTNVAFGRPVAWYPPAYANGRMYVRNDEKCICIELTDGR